MLHYIVFSYVCNVALEMFHALLGQERGGGMGCVGEREAWVRWGAEDKGRSRSIPFYTRGADGVLFYSARGPGGL
jgi:hypothetical protein